MITLAALNAASPASAAAMLDGVAEDAPWVIERALTAQPFATVTALYDAILHAIQTASLAEQLTLLDGYPELAGTAALRGTMGAHSTVEQAGAGLGHQPDEGLIALNAAYRARFGFPFILCIRRHTRPSLMTNFHRRLNASVDDELRTALQEVGYIVRLRLVERITGPGLPAAYGHLSTHVLDTARARPGAGIAVELWEHGDVPHLLTSAVTNANGRTDQPLVFGQPLRVGTYELRFAVSAYLGEGGPDFLDVIPARFRVTEPEGRYHIPLLLSPGAYSIYRGS